MLQIEDKAYDDCPLVRMCTFDFSIHPPSYSEEVRAPFPMRSTNACTLFLPVQNKVLSIGGTNSDYQKHGRVHIYDIDMNEWEELPGLN